MPDTHEVLNQPPLFTGYNAWRDDTLLRAVVTREGGGWIDSRADALGGVVGSEAHQLLATQANRHPPELRTHDRQGRRTDLIEYHPAYHELMRIAFGAGCHSLAWTESRAGRFVARAALNYVWNQGEQGVSCPVTMTFAGVHVVRGSPALAREWESKLVATDYDSRPVPIGEKRSATIGMAMTEKQGGSDLRATQTLATPASGTDEAYRLTGHKWFCSAPMSDAFLTLARLPEGVTCFLVPRSLPDGTRNRFLIQRLKDKVGNRSNASSELEYDETLAHRIGEPGRGIPTLIEMAHLTRFDIVVACAGMMRSMFNLAVHHATHRMSFGKYLTEHALMQNVLADLALETEAALLLAFRLARAFDCDERDGSATERSLARLLTPIAKFWLCKRMPMLALEAMECWGGNGYVEESPLARLYREAPLNGIWEGSGNVICLDVLRAIHKEPAALAALVDEIHAAGDARLDAHLDNTLAMLADATLAEAHARIVVSRLAIAVSAALMTRYATTAAAASFIEARIIEDSGRLFGLLRVADGRGTHRALIDRGRLATRP